jgi:hypothetical protein
MVLSIGMPELMEMMELLHGPALGLAQSQSQSQSQTSQSQDNGTQHSQTQNGANGKGASGAKGGKGGKGGQSQSQGQGQSQTSQSSHGCLDSQAMKVLYPLHRDDELYGADVQDQVYTYIFILHSILLL